MFIFFKVLRLVRLWVLREVIGRSKGWCNVFKGNFFFFIERLDNFENVVEIEECGGIN